ncbi:Low-affinity potassium transport protein [Penicillium argentinense]|uniref:Potassium transport protein n=1 Tax=Penicillium argentinense TaxID=1131581 RepID=A0A9W9G3L2_9EURO|nr:Low-affinity potassium transport protein [Penicillium argentinense]KAJ5111413.1 Low-affinity potassium transport protein [Penicillium argentinense]
MLLFLSDFPDSCDRRRKCMPSLGNHPKAEKFPSIHSQFLPATSSPWTARTVASTWERRLRRLCPRTLFSAFTGRWSAFLRQANIIKQRVPLVNELHLNFIFIHYVYIISCAIISSVIIYPGSEIAYVDALFLSAGAATQSGLNTVDLNKLRLYQQITLYIICMICTPIFIHSALVFVRLYWFEKRFQHVVRDARALRSTRSRMDTTTREKDTQEINRAECGVGGRSIVVLRDTSGDARGYRLPDPAGQTHEQDDVPSEANAADRKGPNGQPSTDEGKHNRDGDRFGIGGLRVPTQFGPEHHIAFLENQRRSKGALRIPSPREYDRGGVPEALDEEDKDMAEQAQPRSPMRSDKTHFIGALEGQHITINEPDMPRCRTHGSSFSRLDTQPTVRDTKEANETTGLGPVTTRNTFRGLWRSLTQERDRPTQPYLSWNATVARNSNFVDLTEEQRDELGGIEYRALKTLAVVLISYYVGFHILALVCMVPWIMTVERWGKIVIEDGLGRPWWGVWTAASGFNDLGFTLTPDSMLSFSTAVFPLLLMTFLILIGNTGFPCMLRLMIWVLSKFARQGSALCEELKFLLDHPRRCFTLLFPRNATWWLFAILVALNGIDVIFFIVLDLHDPTVTNLPPGVRVLDGLFQASCTRTAGFGVVSLADLHPAVQVSYLIMMYISVYPVAISMRRTNVYEEKSLGVYSQGVEENDEEAQTTPSYIGHHLRRQLSFDLWYVFLGLFVIAIAELDRLQIGDVNFQLFPVLFEIVSAYGTVGLSFGYPGYNTSFSAQFNTFSKLVIVSMQIRGRHRGLPYSLDRAVLLPSDSLNKKEAADAQHRLRCRGSNLSGGESMRRQQSRTVSQSRDAGLSTSLQPAANGSAVVQRSSTIRSDQ